MGVEFNTCKSGILTTVHLGKESYLKSAKSGESTGVGRWIPKFSVQDTKKHAYRLVAREHQNFAGTGLKGFIHSAEIVGKSEDPHNENVGCPENLGERTFMALQGNHKLRRVSQNEIIPENS